MRCDKGSVSSSGPGWLFFDLVRQRVAKHAWLRMEWVGARFSGWRCAMPGLSGAMASKDLSKALRAHVPPHSRVGGIPVPNPVMGARFGDGGRVAMVVLLGRCLLNRSLRAAEALNHGHQAATRLPKRSGWGRL